MKLKKLFISLLALIFIFQALPVMANTQNSNPMHPNGFGRGDGRSQPINFNDFHTDVWERFSFNYQFHSGPDYRMVLGRPTQTSIVPRNPETENVRRNAGAAFNPPPAGAFSGAFDAERNNPFAIQSDPSWVRETTDFANSRTDSWGFGGSTGVAGPGGPTGGMLPPTSIDQPPGTGSTASNASNVTTTPPPASSGSTTNVRETHIPNQSLITAPRFFDDGSMGRLSIPALNIRNARVFHGDSYSVIDYNIGHFPTTSAWDGNVGLLAHNGGRAGYFERLHTLSVGDTIIYETPFGVRTYEVFFTQIIVETDFGLLGWAHENMLTLITCVRGRPRYRFALVAVQVS